MLEREKIDKYVCICICLCVCLLLVLFLWEILIQMLSLEMHLFKVNISSHFTVLLLNPNIPEDVL